MTTSPRLFAAAVISFVALSVAMPGHATAQDGGDTDKTSQRLQELEKKVDSLEGKVTEVERMAGFAVIVLFLFGVVLAMWAQHRGGSGCLWFIAGCIPVINIVAALIALLMGPGSDKGRR